MSLEIGTKAPNFASDTDGGGKLVLNELQGSWVILYFYPKDDTSGCTKEACSLNDNLDGLTKLNAIVVGVSPDSPSSHDKFKAKYNLNFKLVSDVDHKISESYNAWGEKSMYGRKYMGIIRSTFLIDPKGVIKHIFSKVNVNGHTEEIIKKLNSLASL
ncbi:MAG: thioredoxin-dependent thiol peroxidase [Candidatus Kapabacteria bacterium]|nr:thioredoxin-dependent thiol peroxidase [Candidatus Kapabacteria bacterium]